MVTREPGSIGFFRRLRRNRNAFAMLMFEPMWGIPYNLFAPFLSLYMAGLGCTPLQIGIVNAVGMLLQFVFSLVAPPITDRLGRNRTTLIFDIISWPGSLLIWIFAQNFWFFLAAAAVQSLNRIVQVSWNCLMIEDTEKDLLVPLFSWFTIAGLLSALFAPVAVELVKAYTVIPAMRWMLAAGFVLMLAMFILRNAFTRETAVGKLRMEQSRRESFLPRMVAVYRTVMDILRNPKTALFFVLTALYNAAVAVKAPYFALLLTRALRYEDHVAGYFAAASSFVMLLIYLFAQPVLRRFRPKAPLFVGLILCAAGSLLLLPAFPSYALTLAAVIVSVALTAAGTAVAQPLIDGICHASIDNERRSDMTSILFALTLLACAPFGLFGGEMFEWDARAPFLAAGALYLMCAVGLGLFYRDEAGKAVTKTK